jgi:hypothetical protein
MNWRISRPTNQQGNDNNAVSGLGLELAERYILVLRLLFILHVSIES